MLESCLWAGPDLDSLQGPVPSRQPEVARYEAEQVVQVLSVLQRETMMG